MQGNKEKPIERRELTRRQEAALLAMLEPSTDGSAPSLVQIAKNIGCNPSTLHRWLNQSAFKTRYRELRRQMVEGSLARLQSLMGKAIDTLERNLDTKNRPSECRAASTIIRQSIEAVDFSDFDERIAKIEKQLKTDKA